MPPISRGFRGRRPTSDAASRLPPGQYETRDFPVLSAGPTPRTSLDKWDFTLRSTAGTSWEGVSIDTLLAEAAKQGVEPSPYVMARSDGGYTTNVPLADLAAGKAWIAFIYDGAPLHPEHGGPARLLVPHLYFWKSAKWVRELRMMDENTPGFWESLGYHIYGDPWREQRYAGDE
jgi:DMSO/TMAO reductase YedYZ molybdopterin-dependent catalytic subunit